MCGCLQLVPDNEEEVGAVPAVGGGDGQGLLPMLENGDEGEQGGKESNEGKCVACGQPSLHSGNTASVSSSSSPEEAAVATIESGAEENGSQSDTRNWNIPLPKAPAAPEGVDQGLFEEMFFAQYRKVCLRVYLFTPRVLMP